MGQSIRKNKTILKTTITISKNVKEKLIELQRYINKCTVIVRDFNTHLIIMGRISTQRISKDIEDLKQHYHSTSSKEMWRAPHPTIAEYTLLFQRHMDLYQNKLNARQYKMFQ